MDVLIWITLGAVALIAIFIGIFIMAGRMSATLTTIASRDRRPKKVRRGLSKLFLIGSTLILAGLLIYFSGRLRIGFTDKETTPLSIPGAQKTLPDNAESARHLSSQEQAVSPLYEPLTTTDQNPFFFGDTFEPATTLFSQPDEDPRESFRAEEGPLPIPAVIHLSGARNTDIFLVAFYNQLHNGKFVRSKEARLRRRGAATHEALSVDIELPETKKPTVLRLPIPLNGWATPQRSGDDSYILHEDGRLDLATPLKENRLFTYQLTRLTEPLEIEFEPKLTSWLQKEFGETPKEILVLLTSSREKPEYIRLATVATILNSYFGYQTGMKNIRLRPGETWNGLLKESLEKDEKLLCDCDVLSTFAFIYLKFLRIDPVFLITFLNADDSEETLLPGELHATIYLHGQEGWTIFEPTLFTNDFTGALASSSAISDSAMRKNKIQESPRKDQSPLHADMLDNSRIAYFTLDDKFMTQFSAEKSTAPTPESAQDLIESVSHDYETANQTSRKNTIPHKRLSVSLALIYLLCLSMYGHSQFPKKQQIKTTMLGLVVPFCYYGAATTAAAFLLLRAFEAPVAFWQVPSLVSVAAPFLYGAATLLAAATAGIPFIAHRKTKPARPLFLIGNTLFSIGAFCAAAHPLTLAAAIAIVSITYLRQNQI